MWVEYCPIIPVECDDLFSKCGSCRSKHVVCDYPQDARTKSARSKRPSEVENLQRQLNALQEQVLGHTIQAFLAESSQIDNNPVSDRHHGSPKELEPRPSKICITSRYSTINRNCFYIWGNISAMSLRLMVASLIKNLDSCAFLMWPRPKKKRLRFTGQLHHNPS